MFLTPSALRGKVRLASEHQRTDSQPKRSIPDMNCTENSKNMKKDRDKRVIIPLLPIAYCPLPIAYCPSFHSSTPTALATSAQLTYRVQQQMQSAIGDRQYAAKIFRRAGPGSSHPV